MFAKIKHLATISENCLVLGDFYEKLFGMRGDATSRWVAARSVTDGYLGLSVNPRRPGRQAGFDHFGIEVQDVEVVFARMRAKYPSIGVLRRPSNRPFAGISTHDPAGNVFDLSQEGMENRAGVYVETEREQARYVKHFALQAVEPERVAQFYAEVFELTPLEKPADDANFYLMDGRITLIIMPWKITNYAGTGIERPQLDHIGFKVESVAQVREDLERLLTQNPVFRQQKVGLGSEGEARLNLFRKCRLGEFQLCDPDGVLVDVSER